MRTRGGEPTLQCRSEPPHSSNARKNGSIDVCYIAHEGVIGANVADLDPSRTENFGIPGADLHVRR